ncbi:MAG: hypothetical protein V3R72_07565 [Gammaproteobacteria bacterium]
MTMARKPNYAFERNAKAKAKAEKREAKRQSKLAAKAEKLAPEAEVDDRPADAAAADTATDGTTQRPID